VSRRKQGGAAARRGGRSQRTPRGGNEESGGQPVGAQVSPPARRQTPAMITPFVDALCVGGASVLVALVVLALDLRTPPQVTLLMILTGFAINVPHFLASYRLLYGSVERRLQYRGVSVYMPLVLLLFMLFALSMYPTNQLFLGAMVGAGSVLLAWHYTGQAWGMMASFAYIEGRTFTPLERRLTRANLYVLLSWHLVWAVVISRAMFQDARADAWLLSASMAQGLYQFVSVAALASSLLGLTALGLQWRRTGRPPTARMVLPWLAIHMWYVLLYRDPAAIFWAQNAHALQYLIFPMRVEMNRTRDDAPRKRQGALGGHMAWYYVGTALLGLLVMQIIPEGVQVGFSFLGKTQYGSPSPFQSGPIQLAVVAFINVHHYFIDNVIWKIRNPAVRHSLFGHLHIQKPSTAS